MIDLLAAVILLLLLIAIWIWTWNEESGWVGNSAVPLVLAPAAVATLIIGVTILGLLGLIDDPYCLRCS